MTDIFEKLSPAAKSLWAKTADRNDKDGRESGKWLSLAQHMVDSADVAERLWDKWVSPQVKRTLYESLELEKEQVRSLLKWLAGTHDIGKATRIFAGQLKAYDDPDGVFSERIESAGLTMEKLPGEEYRIPHSALGKAIIVQWLEKKYPVMNKRRWGLQYLDRVSDAHHGLPYFNDDANIIENYEDSWKNIWDELLDFMLGYCDAGAVLEILNGKRGSLFRVQNQMVLTGLVIMSDWIASNQDGFPVTVDGFGVDSDRADKGFVQADLPSYWEAQLVDEDIADFLRQRFGWDVSIQPRDTQLKAAEVAKSLSGASLMIIEAPTGEGKTEAALAAAEIIASKTGAGGIFFGAPTTATSDALFRRVKKWGETATEAGQVNSLYLAHSRADLNDDYRNAKVLPITGDCEDEHADHGWVVANQWLSGPKRGMLANIVVGTVDQLLMMALQMKHLMLRHVAFAGKIVIIDEVHAYDAYMSVYLHRALHWLSRYGVSVILLSATLPVSVKGKLLTEYAGIQVKKDEELSSCYPLITSYSKTDGLVEENVSPSQSSLNIQTEIIEDDINTLVDILDSETSRGGCVLVLCNTVKRAQEVFESLSPYLKADARLLHACFISLDRADKERELVAELGPGARLGDGRPNKRILIATQVVEQSLDIDVDLLITDIAPIDLLLQRVGRLYRHNRDASERPENMRNPRMFVRGISENTDDGVKFASGVYKEKHLMAALSEIKEYALKDGIDRPSDVPDFVQRAYANKPRYPKSLPEGWRNQWDDACNKLAKDVHEAETKAKGYRIPSVGDPADMKALYIHNAIDRDEKANAQVRDIKPTIEVILVRKNGDSEYYGCLEWLSDITESIPLAMEPSYALANVLARSNVQLPAKLYEYKFDETFNVLERETPPGWQNSHLLRGCLALYLDENLETEICGVRLKYDRELGLLEI